MGDLTTGEGLPSGAFDCFICTQTLQLIYDVRAAIRGTHDLLAPGGVLLCTVPALSQTSRVDRERWGEWWRFTSASVRRLLSEVYGEPNVTVTAHGNALVAASFLYGLAAEELDPAGPRPRRRRVRARHHRSGGARAMTRPRGVEVWVCARPARRALERGDGCAGVGRSRFTGRDAPAGEGSGGRPQRGAGPLRGRDHRARGR